MTQHWLQKKVYSINLSESRKKYFKRAYNRASSYSSVNDVEIIKFKAKDSEIVATPLCLGNISKDFSVDNIEKIGLNGYVYDFSFDYDAITVNNILGIHKYLMKKHNIK